MITLSLVLILVIIFSLTTDTFLTARNISEVFRVAAYTGLICVGTSFVLIGGGIDLSSGGVICFAGVACTRLVCAGVPMIVVVIIAVALAALCGLINGFLITRFHLNDFITTLATGYVYTGFALAIILKDASGRVVSQEIKAKDFLALGKGIGSFSYIAIAWIILTIVAWYIQAHTTYGLYTTAIGSNPKSSEMSGVNVNRMKVSNYVICGACCGLAAAYTVAYQQTAYLSLGDGMGFSAVAACVVGGVILGGGKGDAIGAFLGALFMTIVSNGMRKYGLDTSWQYVFEGAVIMIAIIFDAGVGVLTDRRLKKLAAISAREMEEKENSQRKAVN